MTTQKYPHGRLTVGDSVLVGTPHSLHGDVIDFWVDGALSLLMLRGDNWTFEPDAPPLPTEPGVYVRTSELVAVDPDLYLLRPDGTWTTFWSYGEPQQREISELVPALRHSALRPITEWSPRA